MRKNETLMSDELKKQKEQTEFLKSPKGQHLSIHCLEQERDTALSEVERLKIILSGKTFFDAAEKWREHAEKLAYELDVAKRGLAAKGILNAAINDALAAHAKLKEMK